MTIEEKKPTELDNIIARIKKLQALAKGNQNENELLAATSAAEKLISLHRITQAQLEAEQVIPSEAFKDEDIYCQGRRQQYIESLLRSLCDHFGGSWYLYSRRDANNKGECRYTCVAKVSDWDTIHYFLNYLVAEVDQLAKKAGKRNSAGRLLQGLETGKGDALAFSNAFRSGCADGIGSLFKELREAHKKLVQNSTAMVLLDKRAADARAHMYNTHKGMGSAGGVSGGRDQSARAQGYSAGRNVNISR
jgi:hypothetical protein